MVNNSIKLTNSKLLSCLFLVWVIASSSGCATRALMSSDRYEKPKPETQQFRSSHIISQSWQPDMMQVEQAFSINKLSIVA